MKCRHKNALTRISAEKNNTRVGRGHPALATELPIRSQPESNTYPILKPPTTAKVHEISATTSRSHDLSEEISKASPEQEIAFLHALARRSSLPELSRIPSYWGDKIHRIASGGAILGNEKMNAAKTPPSQNLSGCSLDCIATSE